MDSSRRIAEAIEEAELSVVVKLSATLSSTVQVTTNAALASVPPIFPYNTSTTEANPQDEKTCLSKLSPELCNMIARLVLLDQPEIEARKDTRESAFLSVCTQIDCEASCIFNGEMTLHATVGEMGTAKD